MRGGIDEDVSEISGKLLTQDRNEELALIGAKERRKIKNMENFYCTFWSRMLQSGGKGVQIVLSLEGFSAFDFSEGVPHVSFTQNGVTFNKAVTLKLGEPEYARFLINADTKQVAVQACGADEKNATAFYRPKANGVLSVRWNARDLLNTLERLMGWNLKADSYRADGVLLKDERAIVFDLSNATPLA